jgi:hypothetical protein
VTEPNDLLARVRVSLSDHGAVESPLLGGTSFWVDDRLVISIHEDGILIRVPPGDYPALLERRGVRPYEFAARPVPAWVVVDADSIAQDGALSEWVEIGLGGSGSS